MHKQLFGFSLTELMVVIAIIGVLAVLMLPSFRAFIARQRRVEASINLSTISSLQKLYKAEYNSYGSVGTVGYCGGAQKCDLTSDTELNNPVGFKPTHCQALRYCYTSTTTQAQAHAASDQDGKYIYPGCGGASGDTLTLPYSSGQAGVTSDIIKQCPL